MTIKIKKITLELPDTCEVAIDGDRVVVKPQIQVPAGLVYYPSVPAYPWTYIGPITHEPQVTTVTWNSVV